MSDSPIFDQLVNQFAAKGAVYEEFVRFTTPEFEWEPRHVVQLDKQTTGKGVRFGKVVPFQLPQIEQSPTVAESFSMELPETDKKPAMIEVWKPQPEAATPFGTLLQDYVEQVGKSFAEAHPNAVITKVDVKPNLEDNTLSLVVEGLHPTVKTLSAMDTAEPME
ncbi:hypothetical protein SEA_CLUBPENGUIN_85 [Streptomyces phage ClubPenguin]|nr:hypothetical protein SEA_CLUBPENGUIN_85 [Streptomyces phage ClubPenguin]